MGIGTFGSFTQARLAIYASQTGLTVTGNNISNINTPGYTRQRLDQKSFYNAGADRYYSSTGAKVGQGVLCYGLSQLRDPYLDIRYRNTASEVGYQDALLAGLKEIADTLDEVGKEITSDKEDDGVLYAQLRDLQKSLEQLSLNPTKENDTLVRNSAETLCSIFHTYAKKLETLRQNTEASFKQDVSAVNEILTNIRNLNESIRNCDIHGDNALELRDERNRQIDALSEYMQIKVEYTMEDIGAGQEVEKLTISLGNANTDPLVSTDETVLIDGIYGSQISIDQVPKPNPNYDPNLPFSATNLMYLDKDGNPCKSTDPNVALVDSPNYDLVISKLIDSRNRVPKDPDANKDRPVKLDDNDLYGSLQATRELLTEAGEFTTKDTVKDIDENASIKRGIPYFQKSMDLLARQFADQFNKLNQGTPVDENGNPVTNPVTVTLPTMTQDSNGLISIVNPATGEYEPKPGWSLDKNTGYTMMGGYYVGTHGDTCDITGKIPVFNGQNADQVVAGIKNSNDDVTEYETAKANGASQEELNEIARKLLTRTLNDHGVKPSDTTVCTKVVDLPKGGVLFSNCNDNDDPEGITAANIDISHSWSTGDTKIVPTWVVLHDGTINNTTKNENVDHMLTKINESLLYNPKDLDPNAASDKLFFGSFNDMLSNMCISLGNDQRSTNTMLNSHYTLMIDVDTSRDSVSGVDLNDEAMNMMQFQKAMNAAMRLMTVVDEALDRLINNTGIAGR